MSDRRSIALGRLAAALRLLNDSLESYQRHGVRSADKVVCDARNTVLAIFDVISELGKP